MPAFEHAAADVPSVPDGVPPIPPDLMNAMHALIVWGSADAAYLALAERSGFPLRADRSAFQVVFHLVLRGSARPTDLAEALQTGKSNISKIIRRLDAAGLIERVANDDDDRSSVVRLTPQGQRVGEAVMAATEALFLPVAESFTPEELSVLETLIRRYVEQLDLATGGAVRSVRVLLNQTRSKA